jgi:serine/threonine protein kinase
MAQTEEPRLDATETKVAVPLHKEGCSIADYRKIVRLGEGTFGEVWKAERGGFPVALKILNKSLNSEDAQRELKSLEMLKKLHHKYLIHTENFWSDGDRLFIEMELADGGTLKDRMKAFQAAGKLGIPEDELLKYFLEAAKALDYMHGHRPVFLHRDIKPHNILLVQGCAKLADFGLLRQVTGDNTSTKTSGGTPVYMAPESITEDKFSVQTDLWSFAVTYAELRQGRLPFVDKTQFNIFKKICQEPPYLTDVFHPDEKNVLLKALEKDPHHRFSSCGEFVFELNRVVPWVPATEITVLELPEGSESTPFAEVNSRVPVSDMPPASEFGTSRKRSPNTMQDFELPGVGGPSGSAPTLSRQDGTVSSDPDRRSAPAPEETAKKPRTDQGTDKVVAPDRPKPMPAAAPLEKKFEAPPPAPPPPPRRTKSRQSTLARLFLSTVILAVFAGIGWIGYLAVTSKDADNKKKPDEQPKVVSAADIEKEVEAAIASDNLVQATDLVDKNKSILDQRAKPLVEKIANKKKVLAFFASAKALINKEIGRAHV